MGVRLIKGKRGLTPTQFNRRLDAFLKGNREKQIDIANQAKNYMVSYISSKKKREGSSNNLENNITVEIPSSGSNVYVGDKDRLQANAPYWYVLNYGATVTGAPFVPPENWGFFGGGDSPQTGISSQQWTHLGKKGKQFGYYLTPSTFTPINYIEVTANYITGFWRNVMKGRKFRR